MPKLDPVAAVKHLCRADPVMGRIIRAVGACRLEPGARGDHFTTLLRAIAGQQLSARAAETIWQRLCAAHPDHRRLRPEDLLAHTDAELRGFGMSNAKVAYMKDLAAKVVSDELPLRKISRQDDETIIAELVRVKGIGRWTAEMFLLFKLGRPDVWAVDDLGLRNAVQRHYRIKPTKQALVELGEPWRPHRSVASWYLWRSLAIEPV